VGLDADSVRLDTLRAVERGLVERAGDLALFLVYDRPSLLEQRPELAKAFFLQRCVSDVELDRTATAFRDVGAYVELFEGDRAFIEALASGRLNALPHHMKVVYNGIEGGIGSGGFQPGRKALLPAVADSFGIACSNSNAYACALGRHKFHYLTVLRALGMPTPDSWHFRDSDGWAGRRRPPDEIKVIAKSTYESWSVGVTDESVFVTDAATDERVAAIAAAIGQPVTVQTFVPGAEVCVPVFACPDLVASPPVEAVLRKAPRDPAAFMTVHDNIEAVGIDFVPYSSEAVTQSSLLALARQGFADLQLSGFGRMDFRVDASGQPWLFDVGVSPALGDEESAYVSVAHLGLAHDEYLRLVVATTLVSYGWLK
jgi:D-alanine-D-alanine ligase